MTEAGIDQSRARGREGKTARAREEWSTISAERGREREKRKLLSPWSHSRGKHPEAINHQKPQKALKYIHKRATNHWCSCWIWTERSTSRGRQSKWSGGLLPVGGSVVQTFTEKESDSKSRVTPKWFRQTWERVWLLKYVQSFTLHQDCECLNRAEDVTVV